MMHPTGFPRLALSLFAIAHFLGESAAAQPRVGERFRAFAPARIQVVGDGTPEPRFGTTDATFYRQAYSEFFAFDSTIGAWKDCLLFCTNWGRSGINTFLVGSPPHLPGGSQLTYVELDFCDTSPTDRVALSLMDCNSLGVCGDAPLVGLSTTNAGAPGCGVLTADVTALNYTVDNSGRQLLPFVDTTADDTTTVFLGAVYGYKLRVSPAPATATFPDVPVGHQFHRYVEALAEAGITGGCGGGLYCPDSPLTRGQMAAFLAIALGLHWSQ